MESRWQLAKNADDVDRLQQSTRLTVNMDDERIQAFNSSQDYINEEQIRMSYIHRKVLSEVRSVLGCIWTHGKRLLNAYV